MPENLDTQLHIAVCDDETADLHQAMELTEGLMKAERVACSVTGYGDGNALLAAIRNGAKFHILLLDVMMDEMDGIGLAAALRKLGDSTAIVFISSNREMALRGYEVSAARYLAKPIDRLRLREALLYCYRTFCKKREILLPTGKGQRRIPLSDVLYAEAMGRATRLVLAHRTEEVSLKFSDLAALLPERQFALCHRSYLVNLDHIGYIRSRELELTTGEILPVSKYRLEDLQKQFIDYLSG